MEIVWVFPEVVVRLERLVLRPELHKPVVVVCNRTINTRRAVRGVVEERRDLLLPENQLLGAGERTKQ